MLRPGHKHPFHSLNSCQDGRGEPLLTSGKGFRSGLPAMPSRLLRGVIQQTISFLFCIFSFVALLSFFILTWSCLFILRQATSVSLYPKLYHDLAPLYPLHKLVFERVAYACSLPKLTYFLHIGFRLPVFLSMKTAFPKSKNCCSLQWTFFSLYFACKRKF